MIQKLFFWGFTILGIFLLQMSLEQPLLLFNTFPNFLLLSVVFFALSFGPMEGMLLGFIWGFLQDFASNALFGSQAFMLTLVGYTVGKIRKDIDQGKPLAQIGLVLFMSFINLFGLFFFEILFRNSFISSWILPSFFQMIYTSFFTPLFFILLRGWCKFLKDFKAQ
ncbi:MAG: rod shape-determining protein MreD [Elusimicrobia bacterium RIFCSPLOWO2_02_FULL_39_32]|nr:MAG: rod shape-determining protein MreD [Elusimicrobia bacterium RIFCSPHIGHO2_02_FULL_39_36]OGR92611.1 MAG: rod shape-determining protein MreD [Elusimicrobia bacterium RIFCSPLOWO2_02_FULL_39_32]OGR99257.1 MAG: rod shape-determining protein MreD [Elusimicrobia bacterium RIFCSPLOWO2_12_FULL_39_28]